MNHYPIFLNVTGKKAVVFGAGSVAFRKIKDLLRRGAQVHVRSREFSQKIVRLSRTHPRLRLKPIGNGAHRSGKISSFLKGAQLVFVATSDRAYNRLIIDECRKKGIFVNAADQPELCDFFVPASLRKGKLQVAISTGGASPLLARKFRQELSRKLRPEAIKMLGQMARMRSRAQAEIPSQKGKKDFFAKKIGPDFHFIRNGGTAR
jgi:precorrin-2 dehydrogenase/sirohydrochlorin ferrochelatase